jgi:hypothetical protein
MSMSEVLRFRAPGPWITRDLKECVLASDYDAEIRRLEAEVQMLRETIDAMETMPTGMSQAVCRAMAKYWNGLANRMAREGSPSDNCDLSIGPSLSDGDEP